MIRSFSTLFLLLTVAATLSLTGCFYHGHGHGRHHGSCGQPCSMQSEQCAKCAQDCKMACPNCPCKAAAAPDAVAPAK